MNLSWVIGPLLMCQSVSAFACSVNDIEIRKSNWHMEGDYVHIVGELFNGCSDPVGVELEATLRNKANQIVILSKFWPASTSNIPGKNDFLFDMPEHSIQPVDTMTLRVITVYFWR